MQNRIPMTQAGHDKLVAELEHLKKHEQPRVIKAIAEARAHGDLRENAEYAAAKEQQSFIVGRIHEIEMKLAHSHVIHVAQIPNQGKVIFGATVTLLNTEDETHVTYQVVGEDEADLKHRKISISSPIARAMVGKFVGDEVTVKTPQSETVYEVVKVDYV